MFSFADLKTFNKLGQEDTVLHKLLYSSWVTGLNMLETPAAAGAKNKHLTYQTPKGQKTSITGITKANIGLAGLTSQIQRRAHEISINSLLLLGIIRCTGSYTDKAKVFQRVVAPEGQRQVLIKDKDIKQAVYFLTSMATILQQMQNEMIMEETPKTKDEFDYKVWEEKIREYKMAFKQVYAEFNQDIFGDYANSCSQEDFIRRLKVCGWKYFDIRNLNELFFVRCESLWKQHKMLDKMPEGYKLPTDLDDV